MGAFTSPATVPGGATVPGDTTVPGGTTIPGGVGVPGAAGAALAVAAATALSNYGYPGGIRPRPSLCVVKCVPITTFIGNGLPIGPMRSIGCWADTWRVYEKGSLTVL